MLQKQKSSVILTIFYYIFFTIHRLQQIYYIC